jgi:hypothetical protein
MAFKPVEQLEERNLSRIVPAKKEGRELQQPYFFTQDGKSIEVKSDSRDDFSKLKKGDVLAFTYAFPLNERDSEEYGDKYFVMVFVGKVKQTFGSVKADGNFGIELEIPGFPPAKKGIDNIFSQKEATELIRVRAKKGGYVEIPQFNFVKLNDGEERNFNLFTEEKENVVFTVDGGPEQKLSRESKRTIAGKVIGMESDSVILQHKDGKTTAQYQIPLDSIYSLTPYAADASAESVRISHPESFSIPMGFLESLITLIATIGSLGVVHPKIRTPVFNKKNGGEMFNEPSLTPDSWWP